MTILPTMEWVWKVLLYMCCFYWLINKAAFGQWFNRVKPGRKFKQRWRERERKREKAKSGRSCVASDLRASRNFTGRPQPLEDGLV